MNDFNRFLENETIEDDLKNTLKGVRYSNSSWNAHISAAVNELGATCEIAGVNIKITTSDGRIFEFQKFEERIVPLAEAVAFRYTDKSQLALAQEMAKELEGRVLFEHSKRKWYVFTDHWKEDNHASAQFMIQSRIVSIRNSISNTSTGATLRKELGTARFTQGVTALMRDNPLLATSADELDQDAELLGIPGGYVDLRTGEVMKPDPLKLITMQTSVAPAETADCPKFLDTLSQAHKGQENAVPWMQKAAGEALIGRQTAAHFVFFHGDGGNGKGTFTSVLSKIMGKYCTAAQAGTFTMPKGGNGYRGHLQALARLRGKRLVLVVEPDENEQWDMGRIKEWTGGGDITANLMRQDGQTFQPTGLLILEANHKLTISSVDNAVARRLRMLIWPHKFDGPGLQHTTIHDLADKLVEEEGPGILRWMIEGAVMVLDEGLGTCPAVETASAEYLREEDTLSRFIEDCFVAAPGTQPGVELQDGTALYNEWARHNEAPEIRRGLGRKLAEKGLRVSKTNTRSFIRDCELSEEGMALMSEVLARKLRERTLDKATAERWKNELRRIARPEDGKYLDEIL